MGGSAQKRLPGAWAGTTGAPRRIFGWLEETQRTKLVRQCTVFAWGGPDVRRRRLSSSISVSSVVNRRPEASVGRHWPLYPGPCAAHRGGIDGREGAHGPRTGLPKTKAALLRLGLWAYVLSMRYGGEFQESSYFKRESLLIKMALN